MRGREAVRVLAYVTYESPSSVPFRKLGWGAWFCGGGATREDAIEDAVGFGRKAFDVPIFESVGYDEASVVELPADLVTPEPAA